MAVPAALSARPVEHAHDVARRGHGPHVLTPAPGTERAPLVPAWLDDDAVVARRLGQRRDSALPVGAWARVAVAAQLCAALARRPHLAGHGAVMAARVALTLTGAVPAWSDTAPSGLPGVPLVFLTVERWSAVAPLWQADLARCARLLAGCLDGPEPSRERLDAAVGYVQSRVAAYLLASESWLDHITASPPRRPMT